MPSFVFIFTGVTIQVCLYCAEIKNGGMSEQRRMVTIYSVIFGLLSTALFITPCFVLVIVSSKKQSAQKGRRNTMAESVAPTTRRYVSCLSQYISRLILYQCNDCITSLLYVSWPSNGTFGWYSILNMGCY